jgi:hypothetical protein
MVTVIVLLLIGIALGVFGFWLVQSTHMLTPAPVPQQHRHW